ncbi:hypothetical protein F5884DRAFT_895439 [Xylogone sp. PMI_703]|nr:hypothetical protein F5884DRAFT_895439 [Xylogone sp. PMI_703]
MPGRGKRVAHEGRSAAADQEISEDEVVEVVPHVEVKETFPPGRTFPRFPKSTVYIDLGGGKRYTYALEQGVFLRTFPTLRETIDIALTKQEEKATEQVLKTTGYKLRYELKYNKGSDAWVLTRSSWRRPTPPPLHTTPLSHETLAKGTAENTNIKNESPCSSTTSDAPKIKHKKAPVNKNYNPGHSNNEAKNVGVSNGALATQTLPIVPVNLLEAYDGLFRIAHHIPPNITSRPLSVSLPRVELLLELSCQYRNIHLVRSYIIAEILQYGHELFYAIKDDPVRWLRIALYLECKLIFWEAVIHLVGQYPAIPPTAIPEYDPPESIMLFLKQKAEDLQALKNGIDKNLYEANIYINGEELSLLTVDNSSFATWLVIQSWRDWFIQFHPTYLANYHKSTPELTAAERYKIIVKADDSYLTAESVRASFQKYFKLTPEQLDELGIEEDIEMMKNNGKELALPLVVNRSMLDVEKAGVHYLTCITVEECEYPWIRERDLY